MPPAVSLSEDDPCSLVPRFQPADPTSRPLSDLDPYTPWSVGLAPRVLDPLLCGSHVKQVDFVGHVTNPFYTR